jgi:hypothetical protein
MKINKSFIIIKIIPHIFSIMIFCMFVLYLLRDNYAHLDYLFVNVRNETDLTYIIKLDDSKKTWKFIIEPNSSIAKKLNSRIILNNYLEKGFYITVIEKKTNIIISEKLCIGGWDNDYWSYSAHGGLWFQMNIIKEEDEIIVKYGREAEGWDI